nr:MAG TPA: hypothetical protein [Caudoviricetes sp.]
MSGTISYSTHHRRPVSISTARTTITKSTLST